MGDWNNLTAAERAAENKKARDAKKAENDEYNANLNKPISEQELTQDGHYMAPGSQMEARWKGISSSKSGSSKPSKSSKSSSKDDAEKAAKRAAEKAEKRARKAIGNQYDTILGGLDQLLGFLPGQQQTSSDKFGRQRDFSRSQVADALTQTMGRFGGYENDLIEGQKSTLRDLSSDVRNAFQAGNIYLGTKGASNSSAAGMYSRGIQQAANRNRADVMRQTQSNLADLNIRRSEAEAAAQSQYNEIDNWFNESISDLESQFNQRRQEIEMAKVNATADEQAALAALDMELWRSAQNIYNQLLAQKDFYAQSVSDSISGINSDTGRFGDSMAQAAEGGYNAPTTGPLDADIAITSNNSGSDIFNPIGRKKWKDVGLGINAATPQSGQRPNDPIF